MLLKSLHTLTATTPDPASMPAGPLLEVVTGINDETKS